MPFSGDAGGPHHLQPTGCAYCLLPRGAPAAIRHSPSAFHRSCSERAPFPKPCSRRNRGASVKAAALEALLWRVKALRPRWWAAPVAWRGSALVAWRGTPPHVRRRPASGVRGQAVIVRLRARREILPRHRTSARHSAAWRSDPRCVEIVVASRWWIEILALALSPARIPRVTAGRGSPGSRATIIALHAKH